MCHCIVVMSIDNDVLKNESKISEVNSGISKYLAISNLTESIQDKWLDLNIKTYMGLEKYCVDTMSGWLYYTPTYALQELASGKDIETIAKTRALGLVGHAIAMRPVGMLRNYAAKKMNVTANSPAIDKIKVNVVSVTPVQSVVYGGMLVGGMAWSDEWNWKASAIAWGIGVGLGAVHSIFYGPVQDKVRKYFGIAPAIKTEQIPETSTLSAH